MGPTWAQRGSAGAAHPRPTCQMIACGPLGAFIAEPVTRMSPPLLARPRHSWESSRNALRKRMEDPACALRSETRCVRVKAMCLPRSARRSRNRQCRSRRCEPGPVGTVGAHRRCSRRARCRRDPRRVLAPNDVAAIVEREVRERREAAKAYVDLGREDAAGKLHRQADCSSPCSSSRRPKARKIREESPARCRLAASHRPKRGYPT